MKIYGFHVLNHQIIKKGWDVTPVTYGGRTNGGKWKIVPYSGIPETAITKSTASTSWWWHSKMTCLLDAPSAWIITSVIYISIVMNIIKIIVRIIKFDLRPYDLHARGPCCVNPFLQMHSPFRHSDSATCWNDLGVHHDCDRHHQHIFDQVRFHFDTC